MIFPYSDIYQHNIWNFSLIFMYPPAPWPALTLHIATATSRTLCPLIPAHCDCHTSYISFSHYIPVLYVNRRPLPICRPAKSIAFFTGQHLNFGHHPSPNLYSKIAFFCDNAHFSCFMSLESLHLLKIYPYKFFNTAIS